MGDDEQYFEAASALVSSPDAAVAPLPARFG